jgi:7-cyano-7-deazaguanine synthase
MNRILSLKPLKIREISMASQTLKPRAVVLLSGGLDSLTCLAIARHEGFEVYPISFDYGQKHRAELEAAKRIAEHYQVPHKIIEIQSLGQLGGSALTDPSQAVMEHGAQNGIPNTYVPARNIIFLSIALGFAEIIGAKTIYIGVSAVDYSGYPDCRPEFIQAFQEVTKQGTKAGVEGHGITLATPIIHLSKADTITLGQSLGVDYSMSVSCYRADNKGRACGTCDSCALRKKGFSEAGLADPTHYAA